VFIVCVLNNKKQTISSSRSSQIDNAICLLLKVHLCDIVSSLIIVQALYRVVFPGLEHASSCDVIWRFVVYTPS